MRAHRFILAAAGSLAVLAATLPAKADPPWRRGWRGHEWWEHHRGWWGGPYVYGYAAPPPVVYAPPPPPPPPVVYAPPPIAAYPPGVNIGVGVHIP